MNNNNRSVIFVTTPTSGSQSLWRILTALLVPGQLKLGSPKSVPGRGFCLDSFEKTGRLYMVRGAREFTGSIYSPEFRYVVNFRDLRDMLCNQYYWLIQHPPGANESEEKKQQTIAQRKARFDQGMDASVLRSKTADVYNLVFELQSFLEQGNSNLLFVSYAQLCGPFQTMLDRMTSFLDVVPSEEALKTIALERPENLAANPSWIGNQWQGTDTQPGRFRRELKPETIAELDKRFRAALDQLKRLELPELQHLYD